MLLLGSDAHKLALPAVFAARETATTRCWLEWSSDRGGSPFWNLENAIEPRLGANPWRFASRLRPFPTWRS